MSPDFAEAIKAGLFGDLDVDTVEAVIGEAGKFATEAIAPLNRVGDIEGARCANGVVTTPTGFRDAYRRWAEAGWAGVTATPEYGGMGLPHAVAAACSEMWSARRWASRSVRCSARARSARSRSTAATRCAATYLGRLVCGEWTGTMNLTEPQAGSDLSAVKTRAERAAGRDLSHHRPEDLHHLRRTRHGRQHRPSRAGAIARRAARHARHLAVPGAEIPRQAGRLARGPQRRALRLDRAQARHPRLADLRHGLWRRRRRERLAGRRGESRPRGDVRDDERAPGSASACRAWRSARGPINRRWLTRASAARAAPAAAAA